MSDMKSEWAESRTVDICGGITVTFTLAPDGFTAEWSPAEDAE